MSYDQPSGGPGAAGPPPGYGPQPPGYGAPPPGYGGPPPGYGPSPAGAPAPRRGIAVVVVSILAALALLTAGVAVFLVVRTDDAAASEVFLDPAEQPGPDPFTTQLKVDPLPSTTSPSTSTTTTTAAPTTTTANAVSSAVGSQPGLYGGTNNVGRCDPKQLVAFLEANPDKAKAWVQALNGDPSLRWTGGNQVQVSQIRAYVSELTPLTLTVDTRVTNYGYANGKPTPRQAVLQRGTAVLVDAYGVPRTKCGCGNPLTKPTPVKGPPKYTGPAWTGWNPATVIVIQETTIVINTFVIVNLNGPGYIDRPAGSTGDRDATSSYTPGGSTTSSSGPSTSGPTSTGPTTSATSTTATPTTTAPPTTASTAPVPTLAPPDFCAQFAAAQAQWAGASTDTVAQRQAIMADFDRLTAAAPAEVKADMQLIDSWLQSGFVSGSLDFGNVPADVEAAVTRVTGYLETVCGLPQG